MKTKAGIYAWVVVAIVWVVAGVLYGGMPEQMATHWNAAGMANGYSDKAWGLFSVPIILLVIQGLFTILPAIDPLKSDDERYRRQFGEVALLLVVFMAYLFGVIVLWNKGVRFGMNAMIALAMGGLLYGLGTLLKRVKRNWFMGIRTPWTLSSDHVWDKTHALGGELFKLSGLIALLGLIFPQYAIVLMIALIIVSSIISVIYSYAIYKNKK